MKREDLSEAIGGISARYVQEAKDYPAGTRHRKSMDHPYQKAIAAAAAVCILGGVFLSGIPTAARAVKGYFQNVLQWDGAITGLTYQAEADEIQIHIADVKRNGTALALSVQVTLPDTKKPPFGPRFLDELALGSCSVLDASGKELWTASDMQENAAAVFKNQKAELRLMLEQEHISSGKYIFVVTSVYGCKKAEQPLQINGYWECPFVVD